ncbi:hypothetical protein [Cellulosimicrobium cellulans]|uniref:hypothetical protein n=1 Tax=Cellulosimicrobium cellulans TaxID=1710 RepID=UPI001BAE341E|nr:hypothetical protein [Cellulosimicrobium cellulans]QUC01101.1 hypothetical protein J5A69_08005 [Cellulosimicrobium cellulans]
MAATIKQTIVVDADTRASKQEFSALRREIKREADQMGEDWQTAAQKVEDALREAGARDDLIDAAQRIGREGPSEIEKMQRALRDLDDTARDVAGDVKRAFGDNRLSGNDLFDANFRAEVAASARETGSEILGQISGALADGTIDTTGLAQSLSEGAVEIGSEVGGVFGGAMVAGGLISSALIGELTKAKEAVQESVSSMFDVILQEGAAAAEQAQLLDTMRELTENQDKLNFSKKTAATLDVELSDVTRARAGDEAAMAEILATATEQMDANTRALEAGTISKNDERDANQELRLALEAVTEDYDTQRAGIDAAKAATDAFRESTLAAAQATADEAQALAKSSGQAQDFTVTIDGVSHSLRALPSGEVIEVTDDGTAKLTQKKIDAIEGTDVTAKVNADTSGVASTVQNALSSRSYYVNVRPRIPYVATAV